MICNVDVTHVCTALSICCFVFTLSDVSDFIPGQLVVLLFIPILKPKLPSVQLSHTVGGEHVSTHLIFWHCLTI